MMERKLTKKRKPLRASSVHYPARLVEGDDAQEDVTAIKGEPAQHMNQSIFSMIAAAGSKVDFNARSEEEEEEEEEEENNDSDDEIQASIVPGDVEELSNHPQSRNQLEEQHEYNLSRRKLGRRLGQSTAHKGLRPLPKLDLRTIEEKSYMSQSLRLPSGEVPDQYRGPTGVTPRDAPVMSMMLEAQAELNPCTPPVEIENAAVETSHFAISRDTPTDLATRLMEIFGYERPEEVLSGIETRYYGLLPAR